MNDIKRKNLAGAGTESDLEAVDAGRRRALSRLGLTAAIAYAAPALLPLSPASADRDSSGGGSSGHDSSSGGSSSHDNSSDGSSSHDSSSDGSSSDDHGSDDGNSGSSAPIPPSGSPN